MTGNFVDVKIKDIKDRVKGLPVKRNGRIVGKIIDVSYTEGCRHEGAKLNITAEITSKKLRKELWSIRFI